MSKRIAIFTTFHKLDTQYSVCTSTLALADVLARHGYPVRMFVLDNFPKKDHAQIHPDVDVRPVIPRFKLIDYLNPCQKKHPTFDVEVEQVTQALIKNLTDEHGQPDIDTVITEDIIFQGWFLLHNVAMREAARALPELKWVHWIHSSPQKRPMKLCKPAGYRFMGMRRSLFVSMNYTNVTKIAQMYKIPEGYVRVVYNIRDPLEFFDMHPISKEIIRTNDLLEADVLIIYPTRMDTGKQPTMVVKLAGSIKQKEKVVKAVFCNSYSNNDASRKLIEQTRKVGKQWSLEPEDMIFTSEHSPETELGVPNQVIRDLMQVSNLFILPSRNEGCSLVMLEAALTKNLIVLNDDLYSMHEFGRDEVYYISFGSDERRITSYIGGESLFYGERAQVLLEMLEQSKALSFNRRILKTFNADWIFKNQIAPLL
jgi:hypothetical protein